MRVYRRLGARLLEVVRDGGGVGEDDGRVCARVDDRGDAPFGLGLACGRRTDGGEHGRDLGEAEELGGVGYLLVVQNESAERMGSTLVRPWRLVRDVGRTFLVLQV